ncbi:MAG: hypothetical protein EXS55_00430 [Candidatus Magasanikbacteria bacterium]|nr:hypothetical protein [Candidatus Magasanikbacteria bacterium]
MINKKWIGLFVGLMVGIFVGILPFLNSGQEPSYILAWPMLLPALLIKIVVALGYRGGIAPGVIILLPFFYATILAFAGFLIGKKLEHKNLSKSFTKSAL